MLFVFCVKIKLLFWIIWFNILFNCFVLDIKIGLILFKLWIEWYNVLLFVLIIGVLFVVYIFNIIKVFICESICMKLLNKLCVWE